MAKRDKKSKPLNANDAFEEIEIPLGASLYGTEKYDQEKQIVYGPPPTIGRMFMHIFWVAALFFAFKFLGIYVEERRELTSAAPVPAAVASSLEVLAAPAKETATVPAAQDTPPKANEAQAPDVVDASPTDSASMNPTMSGVATTKLTSCRDLKDVLEYWTDIAKKPVTEERKKWLQARILDVQTQKDSLNCQ